MGSEGEHHPRFLRSRKWNACGGVAAHADAMFQDGPHGWGTAIAKAELQATGTAGGSLYCTRRSARIRLRDQIENEDSRSCRSTTVSSAVAARDPAGNCSTVARWPSHRRETSTTSPSGNSNAS